MENMKPWARGPFELLKHAEGHLKQNTDFDKRLALISFDNAIEFTITSYLQLHPAQRNGRTFEKAKVTQWLANYHSKISFFDEYVKELNISIKVKSEEIIWYHMIRNELYHAGNGMVPDIDCINDCRNAALWVFSVLYNVDPEPLFELDIYSPKSIKQNENTFFSSENKLISAFIYFENELKHALYIMGVKDVETNHLTTMQSWRIFCSHVVKLPADWNNLILEVVSAKEQLMQDGCVNKDSERILQICDKLSEITEFIKNYPVSVDILPELKRLYPTWLRTDITSVRLVQKRKNVYIELTFLKKVGPYEDEQVTTTDLSFIAGGNSEDGLLFSPKLNATENANIFIEDFDPYSIINCTDLFDENSYHIIAKQFELINKNNYK